MIENILESALSGIIISFVCWVCGGIYRHIRKCENNLRKPVKPKKRNTIQKQFFIFLSLFVFSFSVFWASHFMLLKVVSGICALFSFLFVWGAFDAVFVFYPSDDGSEVPSDNAAKNEKSEL